MLSATRLILSDAPSFHFKNPPARPECRTEDFATPYTRRQGLLSFKASGSNSEAASVTFGCSRKSPAQRLTPHAGRCASYCREIPIPPPGDGETVERSWLRRLAPPNFDIEFRTHALSALRHSALRGKHAVQQGQIYKSALLVRSSTPWCCPTTQFAIRAVAPTILFQWLFASIRCQADRNCCADAGGCTWPQSIARNEVSLS